MRIAYVTTHDPADMHAWSGLVHHIGAALADAETEIEPIGPLEEVYGTWLWRKLVLYGILRRRGLMKRRHMRNREPSVLWSYAEQAAQRLRSIEADVVFSPQSTPLARLDCGLPMGFWTDASFAGMLDYYPHFVGLNRESIRNGHAMEQEALSRCRLAVYASDWARQTVLDNYRVDAGKVHVVPFGANLPSDHSYEEVRALVRNRLTDRCRLLFNGVDWERKGGELALEVARQLNQSGLPTELDVVGCEPPCEVPEFVNAHGFVSKSTPEGLQSMNRLLEMAHFLILPSRAECYGVVFAEASSFGVPSLANRTGGIPTVVTDEVNGRLFPLDADPSDYTSFIARTLSSRSDYEDLAMRSFNEYQTRLNWSVAGCRVRQLIRELCL